MPILKSSPYLGDDQRLADVIAAIQATGTYKFYKLDFAGWADRITGDESNADHWKAVFEDHPEFFRLNSTRDRASLVLRRQRPRLFNVDDATTWNINDYRNLGEDSKVGRFSRAPLTSDELEALIDVAINLHSRAVESARDRRWWVPPVLAFLGALAGGIGAKLI